MTTTFSPSWSALFDNVPLPLSTSSTSKATRIQKLTAPLQLWNSSMSIATDKHKLLFLLQGTPVPPMVTLTSKKHDHTSKSTANSFVMSSSRLFGKHLQHQHITATWRRNFTGLTLTWRMLIGRFSKAPLNPSTPMTNVKSYCSSTINCPSAPWKPIPIWDPPYVLHANAKTRITGTSWNAHKLTDLLSLMRYEELSQQRHRNYIYTPASTWLLGWGYHWSDTIPHIQI